MTVDSQRGVFQGHSRPWRKQEEALVAIGAELAGANYRKVMHKRHHIHNAARDRSPEIPVTQNRMKDRNGRSIL